MKQLKFLKTIACEGKPVWYKDCVYEVVDEGSNLQGREMYKLFCEDLKLRGIDKILADNFYKVIEIKDKEEVKNDAIIREKVEKPLTEKVEKIKKTTTQSKKLSQNNQKKKKYSE